MAGVDSAPTVAIDALRRRGPESDIDDVIVSVEPDLASDADRSRAMEKVRGALQIIPSLQRSALEMAYFEVPTPVAARAS